MKSFSIVVAMDEQNGIGKNGDLAWRLSADLKHFKNVTTQTLDDSTVNAVIMGRKTWDSLPAKFKPLPERINVVLSRNSDIQLPIEVLSFSNLDQAFNELVSDEGIDQLFVIGGAQIYAEAIAHPACKDLFITRIKGNFGCDAFFPEIPVVFKKIEESALFLEGTIEYRFCHYQRSI